MPHPRSVRRHDRSRPRVRGWSVALALIAAVVLGACGAAETTVPEAAPPATSAPGTTSTTAPTTTVAPTTASTASTLPPLPPLPEPSPALSSPGDNRVLVLGDSVILGAATDVPRELAGWRVTFDARESRFINNGVAILRQLEADANGLAALDRAAVEQAYADAGRTPPPPPPARSVPETLGRVVVIHLCTNYQAGGGFESYIDSFMDYLQGVERVVWVTCGEWSPGQTEANEAIRSAAVRYPTVVVADWGLYASGPGFTYDDGIHLTETGRAELAALVARSVGPAPEPLPAPAPTTLPAPTTTIPPPEEVPLETEVSAG